MTIATPDNSMEYTERLLNLLQDQESLSADMRIEVEARSMDMIEGLTNDAGDFLHNLDVELHTEDEVKAAIAHFPDALLHLQEYFLDDEDDDVSDDDDETPLALLPIQAAAWNFGGRNAMPFIPLLAEEGETLNVGGEGQRGGLLVEDSNGYNVLRFLAEAPDVDSTCVDVFNRLRQSDLLRKEDVRQYDLLFFSCNPASKVMFEYLVDSDPKALKEYRYNGNPLLHGMHSFAMTLKAGMKHYPEELGFLFRKNDAGKTACKLALALYGEKKAWRIINKCFNKTRNVKMFEMNPVTNVYPFMLAAAGETSELNTLYYLLRRNPIVLDCVGEMDVL